MVAVCPSAGFAAAAAGAAVAALLFLLSLGTVAIPKSPSWCPAPTAACVTAIIAYSRLRTGPLKSTLTAPRAQAEFLRKSHEGDGVDGSEPAVRTGAAARSGGRSRRGGGPRHHLRGRPHDPARQGRAAENPV